MKPTVSFVFETFIRIHFYFFSLFSFPFCCIFAETHFTHLSLIETIMKEELIASTRDDYITLNGILCVGRDGHTMFAVVYENAAVKRIGMRSKRTSIVYTCDSGYSVYDLVWMSENVAAVQTISALVTTKKRLYSVLVLEGDEQRMEITQRCDLNETAQYEGGRLVELRGGELAVKGDEMRNMHVCRRGEQSASTSCTIPGEH